MDNPYFERAVLYIRPSGAQEESLLIMRAEEYIRGLFSQSPARRRAVLRRLPWILQITLGALMGALVTFFVMGR
jgi:hypothetical protein